MSNLSDYQHSVMEACSNSFCKQIRTWLRINAQATVRSTSYRKTQNAATKNEKNKSANLQSAFYTHRNLTIILKELWVPALYANFSLIKWQFKHRELPVYAIHFDFVLMRFLAKVNAFELSPAESCFPFTRISVVESFIFQCEPESMIISVVITNEEKQSSAQILASKMFWGM